MVVKIKAGILVFLIIVLCFPVLGEIMLSQPENIYNVGDEVDFSAAIKSGGNLEGLLKMSLVCANASEDFYLAPISLKDGEEKTVNTIITLNKNFLKDMIGNCNILVKTPTEEAKSQSFEISDNIELMMNLNALTFSPGDIVDIKASALKPNLKPVKGFLEIEVDGTDIKTMKTVDSSRFRVNFSFPENIKSGAYLVKGRVYEKDKNDEVTNEGHASIEVKIRQIPDKVEVAIDRQSVNPGSNVSFKAFIYDQANKEVEGDVSVVVVDPFGDEILKRLVKTSEKIVVDIEKNASAGYWAVYANHHDLKVKRLFYVENREEASFELIQDILVITNTGNVPYRKAVQIAIGNEVEIRQLDLDIGKSTRFRLLAPDGNYRVAITDGTTKLSKSDVSLTGNVIGVMSVMKKGNIIIRYPVVWLFLIMVFGMFIILLLGRLKKKRFVGYEIASLKKKKTGKQERQEKGKESIPITTELAGGEIREAEHTLSLRGEKQPASLIALKIKNANEIIKNKNALSTIEKALESVYDNKGVVYRTGEYIIPLFLPSLTKTFKNDITAVKTASAITNRIKEHNRKFSQKIDFGIGIHSGDVIAEKDKQQNKIKFAGLGNSLALAKKIAGVSDRQVLLSKNTSQKVSPEIKTGESQKNKDVYEIKKIVERKQYKNFITGFLKRHGNETGK